MVTAQNPCGSYPQTPGLVVKDFMKTLHRQHRVIPQGHVQRRTLPKEPIRVGGVILPICGQVVYIRRPPRFKHESWITDDTQSQY